MKEKQTKPPAPSPGAGKGGGVFLGCLKSTAGQAHGTTVPAAKLR